MNIKESKKKLHSPMNGPRNESSAQFVRKHGQKQLVDHMPQVHPMTNSKIPAGH